MVKRTASDMREAAAALCKRMAAKLKAPDGVWVGALIDVYLLDAAERIRRLSLRTKKGKREKL